MRLSSEGAFNSATLSRWEVNLGGYEWRSDLVPKAKWVLDPGVPGVPGQPGMNWQPSYPRRPDDRWLVAKQNDADRRAFDPMTIEGLHERFADVEPNERGILKFAGKYGFLGSRLTWLEEPDGTPPPRIGELLDFWVKHILTVKMLIQIWEWANTARPEAQAQLAEYVKFEYPTGWVDTVAYVEDVRRALGENLVYPEGPRGKLGLGPTMTSIGAAGAFITKDSMLNHAARCVVKFVINQALEAGVKPAIPDLGRNGTVVLVPRDLLGAIYLALAQHVIGRARPAIQCPVCQRWFVPEHGRQKYHNISCRSKAQRQRDKQKENHG